MRKRIRWSDRAKAQLRAIDQKTALRILEALDRLLVSGDGDVQRLQGIEPPEFRLRVGDYRLRFHDLPEVVEVISVRHRREAYR